MTNLAPKMVTLAVKMANLASKTANLAAKTANLASKVANLVPKMVNLASKMTNSVPNGPPKLHIESIHYLQHFGGLSSNPYTIYSVSESCFKV